jgi:hypothetical protein
MKGKGKRLEKYEWIVILDNKAGTGGEKAGQKRGIPRVARDDRLGAKPEREGMTRWTTVREVQDQGSVRTWGSTGLNPYEDDGLTLPGKTQGLGSFSPEERGFRMTRECICSQGKGS